MDAVARPGTIVDVAADLAPPAPLMPAAALGMCSAEARFWLPGSVGWHLDDDVGEVDEAGVCDR